MDKHTAEVFVRDLIFELTMTTAPFHHWTSLSLANVGIHQEAIPELCKKLEIESRDVNPSMKLDTLATKVSEESTANIHIKKGGIFDIFAW